jgi:hypothetical protein
MTMRALSERLGRKLSIGAMAVGLAAGGVLAIGVAGPASAAPVGCTSDFYYTTNANPDQLVERAPSGAEQVIDLGTLSTFTIAIDPVDGQLYALSRDTTIGNHLFRVAADGTSEDLGAISGLPSGSVFAVAGFDDSGVLWVYDPTTTALRRVDVATMTSTAIPTSQPLLSDIAFVNGTMYTITGTAFPPAPKLARVDLNTGTVTAISVPGMSALPTSMWSVNGHLYLSQNATIEEVLGFDTATPTLGQVATLANSPSDGASCDAAASPFLAAANDDLVSSPIDPASGGTTASLFTNDTLNGVTVDPAAVVGTLTDDGGLTGATLTTGGGIHVPAGAAPGTYSISYRICEAAAPTVCDSATASVLVSAAAPAAATGASGSASGTGQLAATGSDSIAGALVALGMLVLGLLAATAAWLQRRGRTN